MDDAAPRGTLGTLHNAAVLLEELSTGPAHQQLTDLAERAQMSVPTVHRLLRSLVAAGLVEQDPRSSRYGLGPELVRLAERYLSRLPVLRVTGPYLVELRNATGGTVLVTMLVDGEAITVDRLDGEDAGGVFRDATRIRAATDSAAGRVLLGHLDDEAYDEQAAALDGDPPSGGDRESWRRRALVQPAAGPADRAEVASPVFGSDGRVVAALAVTGGPVDFTEDRLHDEIAPHVIRAATTISRTLGHE